MYKIYRTNGDFYASVPDNIAIGPNIPSQTSTPINLIGRNKISYGVGHNENFVWLTENFCNTTAPTSAIKGQFWYDTTNDAGTGGELKIAIIDAATVSTDWLSVATVSKVQTLPSSSLDGRLVIYKDNSLKILINSEWYGIVTDSPSTSNTQTSLDILYNYDSDGDGVYDSVYLNSASTSYNVARFNDGAYLETPTTIGGTTSGTLRYGKSYMFTASVMCAVKNSPSIYKAWTVQGTFYVDNAANQTGTADPRKISAISATVTPLAGSSSSLGYLSLVVNADSSAPPLGSTVSEIVSGNYYGLLFSAITGTHSDVNLNWSVSMNISSV